MTEDNLLLVSDEKIENIRFFKDENDHEKFRTSFRKEVEPELERLQQARRQSEERAKKLFVY